jgi:hypothetical protein
MKPIYNLLVVCFLFLHMSSYGQDIGNTRSDDRLRETIRRDMPRKTLYEIGGVKTCEDNFENLKRNWGTKYYSNADEIEILSYRFVGTLKTKRQIKRFIEEAVNSIQTAGTNESMSERDNVRSRERKLKVYLPFAEPDGLGKVMQQSSVKGYLSYFLTRGLNIYEITLTYNGNQYKHKVCCDPTTMKIVGDTLFNSPVDELQ